jgi:hypothetical protein
MLSARRSPSPTAEGTTEKWALEPWRVARPGFPGTGEANAGRWTGRRQYFPSRKRQKPGQQVPMGSADRESIAGVRDGRVSGAVAVQEIVVTLPGGRGTESLLQSSLLTSAPFSRKPDTDFLGAGPGPDTERRNNARGQRPRKGVPRVKTCSYRQDSLDLRPEIC